MKMKGVKKVSSGKAINPQKKGRTRIVGAEKCCGKTKKYKG